MEVISNVTVIVAECGFKDRRRLKRILQDYKPQKQGSSYKVSGTFEDIQNLSTRLSGVQIKPRPPRLHSVDVCGFVLDFIQQRRSAALGHILGNSFRIEPHGDWSPGDNAVTLTFKTLHSDVSAAQADFVRQRFVTFYQRTASDLQVTWVPPDQLPPDLQRKFPDLLFQSNTNKHQLTVTGPFAHVAKLKEFLKNKSENLHKMTPMHTTAATTRTKAPPPTTRTPPTTTTTRTKTPPPTTRTPPTTTTTRTKTPPPTTRTPPTTTTTRTKTPPPTTRTPPTTTTTRTSRPRTRPDPAPPPPGPSAPPGEYCPICMEVMEAASTTTLHCQHSFCEACVKKAFEYKAVCPTCGHVYGTLTGTQPEGGRMDVTTETTALPGYQQYGTITIHYWIPSGIQKEEHPNPGLPYEGVSRKAYLPDCTEGRIVLQLLQRAFQQRLIFTVGRSSTSGRNNTVTWNDIHHKTSKYGGPTGYGYPDPEYLSRVRDELRVKGVE